MAAEPGQNRSAMNGAKRWAYNLLTMVTLTWRPALRAGIPRVSRARWWLYRIATAVAASFVAAAMVYLPDPCKAIVGAGTRISTRHFKCHPTLAVVLRIELALTGILIGFVIAFVGARIDGLILRSRRARGVGRLPSS